MAGLLTTLCSSRVPIASASTVQWSLDAIQTGQGKSMVKKGFALLATLSRRILRLEIILASLNFWLVS